MKVIISDMTDIFSVGFSPELDRSESMLQPALDSYSDVTPSGVSVYLTDEPVIRCDGVYSVFR